MGACEAGKRKGDVNVVHRDCTLSETLLVGIFWEPRPHVDSHLYTFALPFMIKVGGVCPLKNTRALVQVYIRARRLKS